MSDARASADTASPAPAAELELWHVSKTYPGAGQPAIGDLSLTVPAGEICVLVGPSGCGKTTAMRMINRMVELSSGDILLDGRSISELEPARLRREIGYVIQQIGLFPHRTIADNIATVPRLLGWSADRTRARVDELLGLIGLDPELGTRYPAQLSGGQRQRVGVARALAVDPPLMLMDEPFGAIDPINRERLQNEFLRLQRSLRKTIVFVTHDIDEAIKMGDRIAILRTGGELAQYAPPEELLLAPADAFVEDFVGADRGLKRLALQRVRDVDLWSAPLVRAGQPTSQARAQVAASEVPYALLVDDRGRPLGWLDDENLGGELVPERTGSTAAIVDTDDVLRDALSDLLQQRVHYGAVVDAGGVVIGVLSVELIQDLLQREGERAIALRAGEAA